jgi:hypothetical protein
VDYSLSFTFYLLAIWLSSFIITASDYSFDIVQLFSNKDWQPICWITIIWYAGVSVGSTVGLFLFSMSVCRFHSWFVFVFYECLSVPPLVCFCFLWVSVGSTVGLFLFSMSVCRCHRWFVFVFYECLLVPPLVCFCFLFVASTTTYVVVFFVFSEFSQNKRSVLILLIIFKNLQL